MREKAKPNAPYGMGISAASCYDSNVKSPATDLEALIDRYGLPSLMIAAVQLDRELTEHGGAQDNRAINAWLNSQPRPTPRKIKRNRSGK